MNATTGAWIGAGAGFVLAIFEYVLITNIVRKNVQSNDPEVVDQRLRPIRRLMAAGFVILPVFGYLFGNVLVDAGLLPR